MKKHFRDPAESSRDYTSPSFEVRGLGIRVESARF